MEINGKQYEVNTDLKFKTEKFMSFCLNNPEHPKVMSYTEVILKDMLIPSPSTAEIGEFRKSDIEKIFMEYAKIVKATDKETKKKLST